MFVSKGGEDVPIRVFNYYVLISLIAALCLWLMPMIDIEGKRKWYGPYVLIVLAAAAYGLVRLQGG